MNSGKALTVSTPGRICLFGEHQDYLGLPVIPCAISLRIRAMARQREDDTIQINLPDIKQKHTLKSTATLPYTRQRDYFKSSINVLRKHGFSFSRGLECTFTGNIPINSGTSSSSALIVTWLNVLTQLSDQNRELSRETLGRYAHEAEIVEFDEPGGMMDHYATAIGNCMHLEFEPCIKIEPVEAPLKTFVLGDSLEPKDTTSILARVKNQVLAIVEKLKKRHAAFSIQSLQPIHAENYKSELSAEQFELLAATAGNHQITKQALDIFKQTDFDHLTFGRLLTEHQQVLREALRISTPKIDRMIEAALCAGAYGAKINGSGGGGCMFAYAPEAPEAIKKAIENAGGRAFIITMDHGTTTEKRENFTP